MPDELSRIAHLFLSTTASPAPQMTVRALLVEHLPDPAPVTKRIAAHFARQLGSAALLRFDNGPATLRLFSTAQTPPKPPSARGSLPHPNDLSRALSDLPKSTNMLLLDLHPDSALLPQCPEISVVVCPQSKTVVDAYSQLKRLAATRPTDLGLTVVDCLSVVQGRSLAERLCQAAKEFLGLILRLDAVVLRSSRLRQRKLAQAATVDQCTLTRSIASLRPA